jgi:PAS domain-containing protein
VVRGLRTIFPENALDSFLETILDSIADGVFTVDLQWRITSFNRAA